jgi:hypothetical protein
MAFLGSKHSKPIENGMYFHECIIADDSCFTLPEDDDVCDTYIHICKYVNFPYFSICRTLYEMSIIIQTKEKISSRLFIMSGSSTSN